MKEIGQDLSGFKVGLAHLFLQHTRASLTINENCDSDVRDDTETFLNKIVPEGRSAPWKHTLEGPDVMPAHIKSSMFGCTLAIPLTDGNFNMGTWQLLDENTWYNFDDTHISPINEEDVRSGAAYVLFYRRVKADDIAACV